MANFTIELSEHINASPQEVWEYLCEWRRWPEWVTVMVEMRETSDEVMKEGATYRELSSAGGEEFETAWRVTRFDPPRLQVHEHTGDDVHITLTMQVEPDGDGARFIHQTQFDIGPSMEPAFQKDAMEPEMKASVANFVRNLQSRVRS